MLKCFTFVMMLLCVFATYSNANDKACNKEDAAKAENDTDTLKDWGRVYLSYKKYGHCDDGAISEGYSDKICRLLARDWEHLGALKGEVDKDKKFASFIIKHIDDTAKVEDLRQIFINTTENCPPAIENLCRSITDRICSLEKEINGFKNETKSSILKRKQVFQYCK